MRILLLALLLLPLTSAWAAEPDFDAALALYRQGADGDASTNEQAHAAFEALLKKDPSDPVYRVYLGSTSSMMARAAWMPWNKIRYAERGLDTMAKAVALLEPEHDKRIRAGMPDSVRVRSIAGIGFIRVPGFFGRFDEGRALLTGLLNDPLLEPVAGPAKAYIYFFAGEAARDDDQLAEARAAYQAAVTLAPESAYAVRAQAALAKLQ